MRFWQDFVDELWSREGPDVPLSPEEVEELEEWKRQQPLWLRVLGWFSR